jgi:hypothetical protein
VGVVVALSLVGLTLTRLLVPRELLARTADPAGDYLQTLGTIYAVLQAFVVFVVWTQFNEARSFVEREANELMDLFRTTQALPEPHCEAMREHLAAYVDAVLGEEWQAMSRRDGAAFERVNERLELAWEELRRFSPKDQRDAAIFGEALGRFNELFDARTLRITSACTRVPLALRLLLHTGAFMMITSMYLLYVDDFTVHAIITVAVAGAISHILYIVDDLDDAFGGEWQVSQSSLERARRFIG